MAKHLILICLLAGCAGRESQGDNPSHDPCELPPSWTCTEHHHPDYRRCDEPSGLGWVIFPDGVAYREVAVDGQNVHTIECRLDVE